jgi:hypothetical protein
MRLRVACWVTLTMTIAAPSANADFLVNSRVAYDPQTGFYTYSYELDNRNGRGAINELSVLFERNRFNYFLKPDGYTAPAGWQFVTAVSGGIANPPFRETGSFWQWDNPQGLAVGQVLGGFSFSTHYRTESLSGNNYFVFSADRANVPPYDGVVEYGHIAAPDLSNAPEPSTLLLAAAGLATLGVRRWLQDLCRAIKSTTLMALTGSGMCLAGYSSMQRGQSAPIQAPPPPQMYVKLPETDAQNMDAQIVNMFPDGIKYDFGKVTRGTPCEHSFRIINPSNAPLRIISLSWS